MPTVTVLLLCLNDQLSYLNKPYRASSGNCQVSINSTFSYFTNKPQYSELHFSKTYTIVSYSHEEQPTGTECTSVLHKYPSMSVVLHHFCFTVVQKWKAVARWRHWGINSSFTKSAGQTKTAGSRPAGRHELSPCFLSCIEPIHL